MYLPSNLRKKAVRPITHAILSRFIEKQQAGAKRRGQKPVLYGDSGGANDSLQRRNVQEDEGDYNGEDHGGEKREVLKGVLVFLGQERKGGDGDAYLSRLVENRGLLEDAEAAGTCCEEIEKLPVIQC